jgi:hypothetical protein
MIETSVTAVLDAAGVPRRGPDDRPLLQADRVRLLAAERDAALVGARPDRRERFTLASTELADVTEWGHADTGARP